jgi:pyruvate dehydrogenase E1 component beta subunit
MVHEALAAAETLAQENISVEVIDPRTLVPMDRGAIRASVRRTGRLVVADEAGPTCGAAAEICALVTEDPQTFHALKAPVRAVCVRWRRRSLTRRCSNPTSSRTATASPARCARR